MSFGQSAGDRPTERRAREILAPLQEVSTGVARPPVKKRPLPTWTAQAAWKPSVILLAKLKASVKAKPKDRGHRNKLAWALLRGKHHEDLLDQAFDWQRFDSENPIVYEYLGEAFDRLDDDKNALRAFSSIAEVSPGESGLLNRAGYLALRANEPAMAVILFRFAVERRPGHANNYRGLALALWVLSRYEEAVQALAKGLARNYHSRYKNVKRILREEAGRLLGAWLAAKPADRVKVQAWARRLGANPSYRDALRITLHWETDANDVDLHVVDPAGEECYYSHKRNLSGLNLYEDLTQGLGPETAVVPRGRLLRGPYYVGVKYFRAGPMGVSRGVVVIHRPEAKGKPRVQVEPFTLLPDLEGQKQDMRHIAVVE